MIVQSIWTRFEIALGLDERAARKEDVRFETYCNECERMTATAPLKIRVVGMSERDLFSLFEAREVRLTETERRLICLS